MRVLLVSPYSWSVPGGVNQHIASLADQLRLRGHEVRILAPSEGRKAPPGVWSVGRSAPVRWNGSVARLAFGPRVATRVKVAMRRGRSDVVHVHEPFAPSVSMLVLARAKAPCVATFHTTASTSRLYRAAARGLRPLWNKLAVRVAVSNEAASTVQGVFGDGVRVIPNGIDITRFDGVGRRRGGKTILYFGRLERRKGVRTLVDAFVHLRARIPDARLVILGAGPERRACEAAVPASMRADVRFAGRFTQEEFITALTEASVVALPALGGESFGVVLLEAMAARRPLVATNIPGFAAVARDGVEALLVPPGDHESLAAALERVLTDRTLAAALVKAGRARAAEFDWSRVVGQVEKCYQEAVASRR